MFYFLIILFLCIFFFLILNVNKKRTFFSWKFLFLLVAYLSAFIVTIVSYSKDIYYHNIIADYFYLPQALWHHFTFMDISRFSLIRIQNFVSLLPVCASVLFIVNISKRRERNLFLAVCLYLVLVYLLYEPLITIKIYYVLYPSLVTVGQYNRLTSLLYIIIRIVNCALVISSTILSLTRHLALPRIAGIRLNYLLFDICYFALSSSYTLLLSIMPAFVLTISKFAGSFQYKPVKLYYQASLYQILPYIWMISIFLIILVSMNIIIKDRRIKENKLNITKQIGASETATRLFCHYIKNELAGLQAELEYYEESPCPETFSTIRSHVDCIYEKMNEIHAGSRISVLSFQKENLSDIIDKAIADCSDQLAGIETSVDFPSRQIPVYIDKTYFLHALYNLISNACDAMASTPSDRRRLNFRCLASNRWIVLEISDTGNGIPENKLSQIFTPYYSSHSYTQHWGIGLSMVYKIITAHDGQIEAANRTEGGAVFSIYLPNTNVEELQLIK